jgi:tetratricopeptide (TPR) repeat protein
MASQDSNNEGSNGSQGPDKSKRFPTPQQKKRLAKLFEAAAKQDSLNKYDYATDLYADCLRGDPGNYEYLRCLVTTLHKRYVSAKKLGPMAAFKARPEKAALKKAIVKCEWDEALQQGIDAIVVNPWDAPTLAQMATACGGILNEEGMTVAVTYGDCELFYLKCAIDTFPREKPQIDVCIQLAEALKKRDRYQEAITYWHKVELQRPDDELPKREIATLTVLLHQSRDSKFDGDKRSSTLSGGKKPEELTHEQRLVLRLRRNPNDLAGYDELAGLYMNDDKFDKAVEVLNQKLAVVKGTDHEFQVVETIEDVGLKALRSKWIAADSKAKKTGNEADGKEVHAIRAELVERELQTYRNRCERYPNNLAFRFELGRRYQINGNISDAIRELQVAKADPRKRGVCMLYLGDCFYAIKQYSLAMSHYEQAIQDISDRDQDNKKKAYFKAGTLALGLKDLVKARKLLTTLASIDYTYPRIAERLEQLKRKEEEADGKKPTEGQEEDRRKKKSEDEEDEEGEE